MTADITGPAYDKYIHGLIVTEKQKFLQMPFYSIRASGHNAACFADFCGQKKAVTGRRRTGYGQNGKSILSIF
jgi:hypothetical protein